MISIAWWQKNDEICIEKKGILLALKGPLTTDKNPLDDNCINYGIILVC